MGSNEDVWRQFKASSAPVAQHQLLQCNRQLIDPLLSVAWVAASVVETRIADTGNQIAELRLRACRVPPRASLFG